ncbi:MAG: DNA repair protein RadC [Clostridiales Family XIII bacterium]|jgi:DNA repair protein RadC|nr:DNA repair protein RadC [Clostridiales Family XIII bacterium]
MTLMKEMPELERPREKMMLLGAHTLSNAELLAVLLGTGTRSLSATDLAERILSMTPDGIGYLSECMPDELARLSGVGLAKACRIRAAVELGRRLATHPKRRRIHVSSPQAMAELFLENMRHLTQECFRIVLLNVKNEIVAMEEISVGNINSSLAEPREVFRPAIRRSAASLILAHNHPSGNPEPSDADIQATKRLILAGEILGIKVIDHIVIGDGAFISMRQDRLL